MEQENQDTLKYTSDESSNATDKELQGQTSNVTDGLSDQSKTANRTEAQDNIDTQSNSVTVNPIASELKVVPPIPIELNNQLAVETDKIYKVLSQFDSPPLPERKKIINNSDLEVTSNSINKDTKMPDNEGPDLPPRRTVPILPPRSKPQTNDSTILNGGMNSDEPEGSLEVDDMLVFRLNETINELKLSDKYNPPGMVTDVNGSTNKEESEELNIWEQLIRDPENVINKQYETIENSIISPIAIPDQFRNGVWESVTFMKCHNWDTIYELLVSKKGQFDEEQIKIDTKRFFPENEEQRDMVSEVIKTYLNFDPEVEYNESLITIISIFARQYNNDKVKIFGLLCTLMKYYNLREFFLNNEFNDMNKIMFKFDRLLQEHDIYLYNHLLQQGIKSKMFVIDWIKSSFQKIGFDLSEQVRLIDLIFFFGLDILLAISCQILLFNRVKLMSMEYEDLLVTLKDGDGLYLVNNNDNNTNNEATANGSGKKDTVFAFNELIKESVSPAMIRPNLIRLYSQEYDEIYSGEKAMREEFKRMQMENKELQEEVKRLEHNYTLLNREHVTIANELLQNQLKINSMLSDNSKLKIKVLEARRKLEEQIKENNESNNKPIPNDLKKDLDATLKKNAKVMQRNLIYQDKINELENLVTELKDANEKGIYLSHLFSNNGSLSKAPLIGSTWTGFKRVFQ